MTGMDGQDQLFTANHPEIPDSSPELVSNRYKFARDLVEGDVIVFSPEYRRTVAGTKCAIRHTALHHGTGYAHGTILITWADDPEDTYPSGPDHEFHIEGAS